MPKKLKIGSHTWQVVVRKLEEDDLGSTDWNTLTISISSSLPPSLQKSALIHEIFHACNSTLGSTDMGHALLDSLAEQITQVLVDNKLLICK
jgi:hypothetical protein